MATFLVFIFVIFFWTHSVFEHIIGLRFLTLYHHYIHIIDHLPLSKCFRMTYFEDANVEDSLEGIAYPPSHNSRLTPYSILA